MTRDVETTGRSFGAVRDLVLPGPENGSDLFREGMPERLRGVTGHFGLVSEQDGEVALARDALGVNKLFFALDRERKLMQSPFFLELVERGVPPSEIWSVPSGHMVRLELEGDSFALVKWSTLEPSRTSAESPEGLAARVRDRLAAVFRGLAVALEGRQIGRAHV